MSNFTIKPMTGPDRSRILDWCNKHGHQVSNKQDDNGNIVMNYSSGDLKATTAISALKRIAHFDDVSEK